MTLTAVKEKILFFWKRYIKKFLESEMFIYVVAAETLFFFALGWDLAGLTVHCLMLILVSATDADIKATIPLFATVMFIPSIQNSTRTYFLDPGRLGWLCTIGAMTAASMVYGIIKRKLKFKITPMFLALAAYAASLILSGFFYEGYDPLSMGIGAAYAALFLAAFAFYSCIVTKAGKDYVMKSVIAASLAVVGEVAASYIIIPELAKTFDKNYLVIGWGNSTSLAAMVAVSMAFVIYYMSRAKNPAIFFGILVLQFVAIVFTFTRGIILFVAPMILGGCIYSLFTLKGRARIQYIIAVSVVLVAAGIILAVAWNKIMGMLDFYIEVGFDDRGRKGLLDAGIAAFKKAPVMGIGASDFMSRKFGYLYHNSFLQSMAWSGIIGLIAFSAHVVVLAHRIIRNPNKTRSFFGLAALFVFAYSMIDTIFFQPFQVLAYVMFLAYIENDYQKCRALKAAEAKTGEEAKPDESGGEVRQNLTEIEKAEHIRP